VHPERELRCIHPTASQNGRRKPRRMVTRGGETRPDQTGSQAKTQIACVPPLVIGHVVGCWLWTSRRHNATAKASKTSHRLNAPQSSALSLFYHYSTLPINLMLFIRVWSLLFASYPREISARRGEVWWFQMGVADLLVRLEPHTQRWRGGGGLPKKVPRDPTPPSAKTCLGLPPPGSTAF